MSEDKEYLGFKKLDVWQRAVVDTHETDINSRKGVI